MDMGRPLVRAIGRYPLALLVAVTIVLTALAMHFGGIRGRGNGPLGELAIISVSCSFVGLMGVPVYVRSERIRRSGISVIDKMEGVEFEQRLASLYRYLGYSVRDTAVTGDFGADLVLEKSGERTVVQAKRYQDNVGIEAVQQAVAAMAHYRASHATVVTNSYFTGAASILASSNGVELVDRLRLIDLLADQLRDQPRPSGVKLLVLQVLSGVRPVVEIAFWLLRTTWRVVRGLFGAAIRS